MSALRPMRLSRWLVRAVLPPGHIGTYILHRNGAATYVGRSDTDLQRRLIQHADANRADFFTYDVHLTAAHAYTVECSLFHNLRGVTTNQIHPAAPASTTARCPFCLGVKNAKLNLSQR